jgi:outer membrane protein TolC
MRFTTPGLKHVALFVACSLGVLLCCLPCGLAQQPPQKKEPTPQEREKLPPPRVESANGGYTNVNGDGPTVPITFPAALQLALAANLDILVAREVVAQAQANLLRARSQIIPNLNIGSTYTHHEGPAQKTEGNIIFCNKDSLFVGGGPTITFQFTDVLFGPFVAGRLADATRAGVQRVTNDTLLAVVDAYSAVLLSRRRLARIDVTIEFLTADRDSALRGGAKGLLPVVRSFVETGSKFATRADLARTEVEIARRQEERVAIIQDYQLASAELARLLRLDPALILLPLEDPRYPMPLPGQQWYSRPVDELVGFALANRPEVAENQALVQATLQRVREAKWRPWLPNVALGYSWGDFGGGPDTNPNVKVAGKSVAQPGFGPSGRILHFDPRTDFDVSMFWRLQNFGFGNCAEIREQEAINRQAMLRRLQATDRIVAQVVGSQEAAQDWAERVRVTRSSLFDSAGRPTGPVFDSLRLSFLLQFSGEVRPLEVLDSIRGLNDLLEAYAQAITAYERAQFRLLVALGLPPQTLVQAVNPPAPPQDNRAMPPVKP